MIQLKKLNLGCGQFPKQGYVNLDISSNAKADVSHNLNEFPYPFEDNSFSLIEADHVLEHLGDSAKVMKELHRILEPNGKLIIRVPHFSRGFTNPDHRAGFDISFPFWFSSKFQAWYVGFEFKLRKTRLTWFAQPYFKKELFPILNYPLRVVGGILDFLANLSPAFCSRIWCYWVGGFEEIEFIFIKPK
jgi:SAM-dependent methyltransferase|tara:strand:+ start:4534 stop:5100 length:567 start_codon:yes stop_codon:yes gene_type:complete